MQKYLLLTSILLYSCVYCMAQQKPRQSMNGITLHRSHGIDCLGSNWFVGIAGGINVYEGELNGKASLGYLMAPALDIYVGKWINSLYGVRLQYAGLKAKGLTTANGKYAKKVHANYFEEKFNVSNLHADFLWNSSNTFWGLNEKRIWNFIPYAGLGWARSWGNDRHRNEMSAVLGILNTFRLNSYLDLTLEGRQMFVKETFDGITGGLKGEGMTSVTVGLSIKLD